MDQATANTEATQIRRRARAHKRAAKVAQAQMHKELEKLDAFRAMCAKYGITIIFEDDTKREPIERQTHDSSQGSN